MVENKAGSADDKGKQLAARRNCLTATRRIESRHQKKWSKAARLLESRYQKKL